VAWLGCERAPAEVREPRLTDHRVSVPPPAEPEPDPAVRVRLADHVTPSAAVSSLLARFECNRCHDGLPGEPASDEKHCVRCHQQISAGTFPAPAATLAKWRADLVHLRFVPALRGAGRLRPDWIAGFLRQPHALRPMSGARMPRLPINVQQSRLLGDWLGDVRADTSARPAPTGDAAAGGELFVARGCMSCHSFTGARLPSGEGGAAVRSPRARVAEGARANSGHSASRTERAALERAWQRAPEQIALAPDLRFTRDRMHVQTLVAWLVDPESVEPGTRMPPTGFTAKQATDVAAFLMTAPLGARPPGGALARLNKRHGTVAVRARGSRRAIRPPPLLARKVGWPEVAARVLKRTCWHCHSDPDFARGDGGPGNTGGFGFAGRRVRLMSLAGVHGGMLGADGSIASMVDARSGESRLVASLLARHSEEAGTPVPGVLGMPLGFPAIPMADIALVRTWVAQGAPRGPAAAP